MQRGAVRAVAEGASDDVADDVASPSVPHATRDAVDIEGFNLEASVRIDADDDVGRERLFRYGARPPFALGRMRMLPGGRVAYRIKQLRDGRAKSRVMTPSTPPACRSSTATTKIDDDHASRTSERTASSSPRHERDEPRARSDAHATTPALQLSSDSPSRTTNHQPSALASHSPPALSPAPAHELLAPNIIHAKHWTRLLEGRLFAASARIDWATLLHRTFDVDVLECPTCHGRLRVLGLVTNTHLARSILEYLGLPTDAPRAARARDPTELDDTSTDD